MKKWFKVGATCKHRHAPRKDYFQIVEIYKDESGLINCWLTSITENFSGKIHSFWARAQGCYRDKFCRRQDKLKVFK